MANIQDFICRERDAGKVTCAVYHGKNIAPRTDRLKALGFQDIPENSWIAVSMEEALAIATSCLHQNLEDKDEIMSRQRARELVEAFFAILPADCTFRTNGNPYGIKLPAWINVGRGDPISFSRYDTGIIAECGGVVGILWVEDGGRV